jgi:hypothetical protein
MWWRRSDSAVERTVGLEHGVDPQGDYPCPCRHRGRLKPIALMETLGCELCPQMFNLQTTEKGLVIESALTGHGNRRQWRWNGRRWLLVPMPLGRSHWPVLLCVGSLLCTIGVPLILRAPWGATAGIWIAIALAIAAVPVAVLWLTDRH